MQMRLFKLNKGYSEIQFCVKCAKCAPKIKTCDNNLASTMFEEKTERCLQN